MPYNYPLKFGKYLLTRRIAVGGMAEVFKAKLIGIKGFEKTLALKRILPEFSEDDEFVQMFVDEARISSSLHHGNIVQVFDFGQVDKYHYMAMEFVDGPNLKNLIYRSLRHRRKISHELATYILIEIARALEYAHNVRIEGKDLLNLVHRDVSPQNILVSRTGDIKISDFGIAKAAIKLTKTQPGKIQGKFSYMSPEQAAGKSIDRRSDIFSLGIMAYELFSGVKVYGAEDTVQRYKEVREAKVPQLGTLVKGLPSQVENLVMRMLSKDPDGRPNDCDEVVYELSQTISEKRVKEFSNEIGLLVHDLFPPEKSDSGVAHKVNAILEGGKIASEPGTEIDDRRVPSDKSMEGRHVTKSIDENESAESTISSRRGLSWVWYTFGSLIGLGAAILFITFFNDYLNSRSRDTIGTNVTPTDVIDEDEFMDEDLDMDAELMKVRRGPVDADLKAAMDASRAEFEARIVAVELERDEAKEQVKVKDLELKETKEQLKIVSAAALKPPCPDGMVLLPLGQFLFGSKRSDPDRNDLIEPLAKIIPNQPFCIDRFEYPNRRGVMPIIDTSWLGARGLCAKKGKRLCLQEEWERACKGSTEKNIDHRYPYGNRWQAKACNTKSEDKENYRPTLSGFFSECKSPEGVFDLSGNVDEWTASAGRFFTESRVVKGGSMKRPSYQTRCSSIREIDLNTSSLDLGFRCCKDAS